MSDVENILSSTDITNITEGRVDGRGVFDTLMRTVNAQLELQFKSGRITGNDVASVLTSVIPNVLEQSIAYTLTRCKTEAETNILIEQAKEAEWRAKLAKVEHDLGLATIDKTNAEISLINQNRISEMANTDSSVILNEDSMLGIQRLVQQRQADGFLRDAEQKAVNTLWDVAKVLVSVGDDVDVGALGADNENFKASLLALMEGAGITTVN